MTTFDYCVLAFLPVAAVLITIQLYLHDWSLEKLMFEEEEK